MSEIKEFKRPAENTVRRSEIPLEPARTAVQKTYKLFINGNFPRTESGRCMPVHDRDGTLFANACRASRKDVRDAAQAARSAFTKWSATAAYTRGQILYRIAEILEDRRRQFEYELKRFGATEKDAAEELNQSIDRLVHFAGWSDKFQQIASTVNPVASSHFVFSVPEPTGVVAGIASGPAPLLTLVSLIAPILVSGNTCICLPDETNPLSAITFAEVLQAADVPAGVVNILTGLHEELVSHLTLHMDINAVMGLGLNAETMQLIRENAACNVKRTYLKPAPWINDPDAESPYPILALTETKTTWHPIGR